MRERFRYKFAALFLISTLPVIGSPSYERSKSSPCKPSLKTVSEQEEKLVLHVKFWVRQYSGFIVESVDVRGSQITIRGIQIQQSGDIRKELPEEIQYRKKTYKLKIKITGVHE